MTLICKECGERIEERGVIERVSFDYKKVIEHTKKTGHHLYKIAGLKMEINVG